VLSWVVIVYYCWSKWFSFTIIKGSVFSGLPHNCFKNNLSMLRSEIWAFYQSLYFILWLELQAIFYQVIHVKGKSKFWEMQDAYRERKSLSLIKLILYESRMKSPVSLNKVIFVKTQRLHLSVNLAESCGQSIALWYVCYLMMYMINTVVDITISHSLFMFS